MSIQVGDTVKVTGEVPFMRFSIGKVTDVDEETGTVQVKFFAVDHTIGYDSDELTVVEDEIDDIQWQKDRQEPAKRWQMEQGEYKQ